MSCYPPNYRPSVDLFILIVSYFSTYGQLQTKLKNLQIILIFCTIILYCSQFADMVQLGKNFVSNYNEKGDSNMPDLKKPKKILDALQQLLEEKTIQHISVSEIASKAGIGKGSIYYYFPSKDAIVDALIKRSYEQPLQTAKTLSTQTNVSSFTRMAMLFQACRDSSAVFLKQKPHSDTSVQDLAFLHQKYLNYLISELKPVLTDIISQGIACGEIHFDHPAALAEIALIVIAVKLDNSLVPSSSEETEDTLKGLISLLENGTGVPAGTLKYLSLIK